jgi:hypothetical protein
MLLAARIPNAHRTWTRNSSQELQADLEPFRVGQLCLATVRATGACAWLKFPAG